MSPDTYDFSSTVAAKRIDHVALFRHPNVGGRALTLPVIGIIGGTGFIGLNLSWTLQNEHVACRTFSRNGLLLDPNNPYYPTLSEVQHVQGDFRNKRAVAEFIDGCRCVVLLVSHLLPSSSADEIKSVTSWFVAAFGDLLEISRQHAIEQVVFISSGGTIYGENYAKIPVDEEYPLNAQSAYGSFCALLEQMLQAFDRQHGQSFTILRVGNPYGPLKRPNKDQGLIDRYIQSARAGLPFTIYGDGQEIRDYIYIDDISAAIARVLRRPGTNEVFNVGTGVGHTSLQVISLIKEKFKLPAAPLVFANRRPGDVQCSLLDMSKFRARYGVDCPTALEDGLRRHALLEARPEATSD